MRLPKRIAAALTAAAMAVTAFTVTAFATDPVGTKTTKLKEGKQVTTQIKYDDSWNYDNGHNYADFRYTAPADGVLVITFDAAIDNTNIAVYKDSNKQEVELASRDVATGEFDRFHGCYAHNNDAGIMAATVTYKVEKGDYIIRVSRSFHAYTSMGEGGNGRLHITAEMKKPDAPTDLKATKRTSNSVTLSWAEPNDADSYDIRYRANGAKDWQTKNSIKDNTATIKDLKANTKYTVQIRSKAGKITGEWGDKLSVTTKAAGALTAPTITGTVTLSWTEVEAASSYEVNYSTDGKNWKSATTKTNSYSLNATSGTKYYYAVRGVSGSKKGPWSATCTVTFTK